MKKLLIGFLALTSMTAFAGSIINKKSGQIIELETKTVDNKEVLVLDGSKAGLKTRNIILEKLDLELKASGNKRDREFDPIFMATNGCHEGSQGNDCGVGLVFALGFDIVTLPITLPLKLIHSQKVKSDLNVIHKSIYRDAEIEAKSNQFDRIAKLLNL